MCRSILVRLAMAAWLGLAPGASAQSPITNVIVQPPATKLEALETTVGKVVLKGRTEIGTVTAPNASVSVFIRESSLVQEGAKEHGITMVIKMSEQPDERTMLDYDEIDSLAEAMEFFSRIDFNVTRMSNFDASYTSKAGLRVDAFSSRRTGRIEFALRTGQMTRGTILAPEHLAQLRSLVDQAKRKLDELRRS